MVEKFCGRQAAVKSAKTMILDMGREMQTPYISFHFSKDHGDVLILKAQEWIEQHYIESIDYDRLPKIPDEPPFTGTSVPNRPRV